MKETKNAKIVFLEVEDSWEQTYLRRAFGDDALYLPGTADEITPPGDCEVLSVFIKSKIDDHKMASMPRLKLITTRSTGFDHIDTAAAAKRGVLVSNVPVYGENTVAEHTFALILSLSRNLRKAYFRTMQNDFSIKGLMGFDLKGKTIGIIGTGHIGLHVIRMAIGFGMKVIAFDVKQNTFLSEVMGFEYSDLDNLLMKSDILSLHVPFMPSTKHLINKNTIKKIKKGAILINTARGGLVETGALVQALDEGILSGVGLDVLEEEEYVLEEKRLTNTNAGDEHWSKLQTVLANNILLHRENVIYTPHMAFYSKEAVQRILDTTIENIRNFLKGSPVNRINIDHKAHH